MPWGFLACLPNPWYGTVLMEDAVLGDVSRMVGAAQALMDTMACASPTLRIFGGWIPAGH